MVAMRSFEISNEKSKILHALENLSIMDQENANQFTSISNVNFHSNEEKVLDNLSPLCSRFLNDDSSLKNKVAYSIPDFWNQTQFDVFRSALKSERSDQIFDLVQNTFSNSNSPSDTGFCEDKKCNITESIYVPSSEHVAEIVGRQGCKIKALRNKTNTYIKTPTRGDDPVFVITGRKDDVEMAKLEINQAAEHFSQLRAQRRNGIAPPPLQPGQLTKQVRVPYRVVGLVVGPKGSTIKQIQQKTRTYIVTPSREKEPIFEITGFTTNVEEAEREILEYITSRTGTSSGALLDEVSENSIGNTLPVYPWPASTTGSSSSLAGSATSPVEAFMAFNNKTADMWRSLKESNISSDSNNVSSALLSSPAFSEGSGSTSSFKGLSRHDSFDYPLFPTNSTAAVAAKSFQSDVLSSSKPELPSADPYSSLSSSECKFRLLSRSKSVGSDKNCVICKFGAVHAALVPCGHNNFCFTCADNLVKTPSSVCPICRQPALQALRILH